MCVCVCDWLYGCVYAVQVAPQLKQRVMRFWRKREETLGRLGAEGGGSDEEGTWQVRASPVLSMMMITPMPSFVVRGRRLAGALLCCFKHSFVSLMVAAAAVQDGIDVRWKLVDRIIAERRVDSAEGAAAANGGGASTSKAGAAGSTAAGGGGGGVQYLVKWQELQYDECTWEDASTLLPQYKDEVARFKALIPIEKEAEQRKAQRDKKLSATDKRAAARAAKAAAALAAAAAGGSAAKRQRLSDSGNDAAAADPMEVAASGQPGTSGDATAAAANSNAADGDVAGGSGGSSGAGGLQPLGGNEASRGQGVRKWTSTPDFLVGGQLHAYQLEVGAVVVVATTRTVVHFHSKCTQQHTYTRTCAHAAKWHHSMACTHSTI